MINKRGKMKNKRGQVTIFIIIAVIVIAVAGLFFAFRGSLIQEKVPATIEPVYNKFLACVEENTLAGISVLGSQAGYIYLPEFEPGSRYMPFSSQLDFLGNPVPYWYYVSENNIQKEQIPTKNQMNSQLEQFIEEEINDCVFDQYYGQGFVIEEGVPDVRVSIKDDKVDVDLNMRMKIIKGDETFLVYNHDISVDSNIGKLYDSAKKIYEEEQEELFLERYAVDNLRLYAPVDGVEITCSPLVWSADKIFNEMQDAIEANTLALKAGKKDYVLNDKYDEYFVVDLPVDTSVRFINSKSWPHMFEINPSEGNLLMAKPVGLQPGLGVLGFCYVPYHFVYNVRYPVLVQLYEDEEIFQFPIAIVLQNNIPREAFDANAAAVQTSDMCSHRNTLLDVSTYDDNMNPVDAEVSFECFGEICYIGESSLTEMFPQCVNGNILARAEGFRDARYMYTTTQPGSVSIILDRLYEKNIDLNLNGGDYTSTAMIYFISEEGSKTIIYPGQKKVELVEGEYEIQVYIYRNASLSLDASTVEQCIDVPKSGIAGLFGATKKQCIDVDFPAQVISNALAGGGKQEYYFSEDDLESYSTIEINTQGLKIPETLEELQNNYLLFEDKGLEITLK